MRTLVGSIGLVAAVPITTALAAAVAAQEKPAFEEPAPKPTPKKPRPAPSDAKVADRNPACRTAAATATAPPECRPTD